MRLRVRHRTHYAYGEAVTTSHHEARLSPRESEYQRTVSQDIQINPAPQTRKRRFDYFGNRTVHFSLSAPHRELEVIATSVVDTIAPPVPTLDATPPWEQVRERLRTDRRRDVLDAFAMTLESPNVPLLDELREYAEPSFGQGVPLLVAVRDLVSRIHKDFVYDPSATDLLTPLDQVFTQRRGVCQDFAHLAIACVRNYGLAARYVSGYLLTRPPPGKVKLVGADASHAWLSVWVAEQGWVDFDPTNDVIPADEHLTTAFGRDFSDVTPLRGVLLGAGSHTLTVNVDVTPTT
jgi:transglutaminase-like putative cysteine protease